MESEDSLVEVRRLKKYFPISEGFFSASKDWLKAIDGVDLAIRRGETLSLVGESGCGKSTLGRVILRLEDPTAGEVLFKGEKILNYERKQLQGLRRQMQIIFQDPYSSLDPRQSIESIISEPLAIHGIGSEKERKGEAKNLLELVGLRPEYCSRYPHEFSGGQRQRIGIARALALHPEFVVCDEPVSALDVSVQAQVLNLLKDLQQTFHLTYLFIAHDLSIVNHVSDRVAVMYLGRIMELAAKKEFYRRPYHPYAKALLAASPIPDPSVSRKRIILGGDVPSPINPPSGCHFHTRCPYVIDQCRKEPAPPLDEINSGHWARCWRVKDLN
jgi:oligopeptide transport system ATP-binding protein